MTIQTPASRASRAMILLTAVCAACALAGTAPRAAAGAPRVFETSFESVAEVGDFYIVPQNHLGTASHELSEERVRTGRYTHKGWIYGVNRAGMFSDGNHRGYPTIQLHKLPGGGYTTPCMVDFWVWLDATLRRGQWFSFATLSADPSDRWDRVVLLNVGSEGWPHLMHVPRYRLKNWRYQNKKLMFPMREWVHFKVYLDFDPKHGMVKAWMNDTLVSEARFEGGARRLEQAHFGLYAPPSLARATIFNDDLAIRESVPREAFEGR
jgi:hypothetical protein